MSLWCLFLLSIDHVPIHLGIRISKILTYLIYGGKKQRMCSIGSLKVKLIFAYGEAKTIVS
jgi:hypothetical protein